MTTKAIYATGRRKTASARVFLSPVSASEESSVVVNNKGLDARFTSAQVSSILRPFDIAESTGGYSLKATVRGGGVEGQVTALQLGIARALEKADAGLRPVLKKAGMLSRDPREVERKKAGRHKARKSTQFSKR